MIGVPLIHTRSGSLRPEHLSETPAEVEAWLSANNQIADTFIRLRDIELNAVPESFGLSSVDTLACSAKLSSSPEMLVESEFFKKEARDSRPRVTAGR